MGRTVGRSSEDTRRLVLDAAAAVVRRHGPATSLDAIAREAGVSKGGLIYHFASKDALFVALADDLIEGFRDQVLAEVDEPETTPGRLTRAYVRASLVDEDGEVARERFALIAQLFTLPAILALSTADDRRWRRDLDGDGVPRATQSLVIAAADGFAFRPLLTSAVDDDERRQLRADLLALIAAATAAGTA